MNLLSRQRDLLARVGLLIIWATALIVVTPRMLSFAILTPLANGLTVLGLLALGLGVTMIAGELDLSIASVAAAAAVLAVIFRGLGPVLAILLAIAIATAFGALQGYLVARLGISSLMLTLASLVGVRGIAHLLAGNTTVSLPGEYFSTIDLLTAPVATFLNPSWIVAMALFVGVGLFLALSRWGREIYAVGGGRDQARGTGISDRRPMAIAFGISGLCAGTAGAMSAWTQGAAVPTGFELVLLPAATAALVGGIALSGGRGTVVNILVGTLIMQLLAIYLTSVGAPSYVQNLLTGLVLLAVLVVEFATDPNLRRRVAWPGRMRRTRRHGEVEQA